MPLIKDKYGAKGAQTRSKYVTRTNNPATTTESIPINAKTTAQKQQEQTKIIQSLTASNIIPDIVQNTQTISGTKLSTINIAEQVVTLMSGESLDDIIISHYSASGNSTVGIYWSTSPISELTFTISSGIITAAEGGTIYRLLSESFPSFATLSLSNNVYTFNNISKDIYFYAVCSVLGAELTIIKS